MANTFKKISISIPMELDNLIDRIVKESKDTPQPLTKSGLIAVAIYEYLDSSLKYLKPKNSKEEN